MVSRSKRASNNKWDAANMTVLACKLRKDDADDFKQACKDNGTTVNAVFRAAIDKFMIDKDMRSDD